MNQVYDKKTIVLHWLTALLVIGLWCAGQSIDWFPKGAPRVLIRSSHILFGALLSVVLVYRVWWRATAGTKLPPAASGWQESLAKAVHHLIYLMIATTVVLGIFNTWVRGDNLFNLFQIPSFAPSNNDLRHQVEDIHALAANILIALAGFHAAAGLAHHYVLKDTVLQRMLPSKKI
ncbi:cytochrome b [Undibacterium sp. SXout20W]|uniref:cytochrome b n=1 Tax=Undibacterium sp. SXout20W TaxID=3413051 RepID=UPI003BF2FBD7